MTNSNPYLIINTSVFLTKGASRSIITNPNNNSYDFIPNDLYDLLINFNFKSKHSIFKHIGKENHKILDEYFSFLIEKRYVFFVKNPDCFLQNDLSWHSNYTITNSIIDFNKNLDYNKIIHELSSLGCNALQIRIFEPISFEPLNSIIRQIEHTNIKSIEIIIKNSNYTKEIHCVNFIKKYSKIVSILIYGSENKKVVFADNSKLRTIIFIEDIVVNKTSCGIIHPNYFAIHPNVIRESYNYNTCLNKKISIDADGSIKNCPSMKEGFGNIKNTSLTQVLENSDFKKYWNIKKDDIDICKDCEFRNICTDCRAYIENPKDIYSKPLKCGYSPYTNEWEEWSINPLKQKAIEHYKKQNLIIKK